GIVRRVRHSSSMSQYTAIEILHEGSDTLLYRAQREDDGLPVVLKVLRRDHESPRALGRLHHEYEIAAALDTKAIVRPHGLESFDDRAALVLEDFGGRSLDRLLDGPMPIER